MENFTSYQENKKKIGNIIEELYKNTNYTFTIDGKLTEWFNALGEV